MTRQEITGRVRKYVVENFLYTRPDYAFADSDSLFAHGIIDSLGAAELIVFIQDQFGIDIGDDEVTEENLGSLAGIADFIVAKRPESVAA